MFRYNNGQFRIAPPATVEYDGYLRSFAELNRQEWDEIGYNEALPIERAPFTTYVTRWVKGGDLIYREEIISSEVDEAAKQEYHSTEVRSQRDRLLTETDWTQLADSPLDANAAVIWQSYRQALRDIPQQPGFPLTIEWPEKPAVE